MGIVINLDVILAKRKVKSKDLAAYIGITEQNLSLLKSGKVKGICFSTLEKICERRTCQPGGNMEWVNSETGATIVPENSPPNFFNFQCFSLAIDACSKTSTTRKMYV